MASTARRLSLRCTAEGSLERAAEPRLGSIPLDGPFATMPTLPPRCPKPRPPQVRQARVRGAGGARGRRRRVPAPARARGPRAARRRRSGGRAFCRAGRRRRRRGRLRGVGPVARRRPRRGLGPLGAHAADVVASHRSGRPRGSLAVAPSRPGVLSFFRGGVPVTERSQGRGLRAWGLLDPINTPSPRQSYSHRGPRRAAARGRAVRRHARARRSFPASAFFNNLRFCSVLQSPSAWLATTSWRSSLARHRRDASHAIDATAKRRRGRALAALRRGAPGPRPVAAGGRRGRRGRPRAAPRRRGRARRRLAVAVEVAAARVYCPGVLSFPRRRSWPIQRPSLWA